MDPTRDFLAAAVQFVPVLIVVLVADNFIRQRDADDPKHRRFAGTVVLVGALFGLGAAAHGLLALGRRTEPGDVDVVGFGLAVLAAAALVPRLVELLFPEHAETARRTIQVLLPGAAGITGVLLFSGPMTGTTADISGHVVIGVSILIALLNVIAMATQSKDQEKVVSALAGPSDPTSTHRSHEPTRARSDAPRTDRPELSNVTWLLIGVGAASAASVIIRHRHRHRHRSGRGVY